VKTKQEVLEFVSKNMEVDISMLDEDSTLESLGLDSLDTIELMFDLEEFLERDLPLI